MKKNIVTEISFVISEGVNGLRLDRALSQHPEAVTSGLSRSQVKQLIDNSMVKVNEVVENRASRSLKVGDRIECQLLTTDSNETSEYDFKLSISYEDDDIIVIDKPANLTVHPGANTEGKTLLNALVHYYQSSNTGLPQVFKSIATSRGGIVHRLDKDTSGLLVVAKTLSALQFLARQFAERTSKRLYQALVYSTPRGNRVVSEKDEGQVDLPIGRDPVRRVAMGVGGVGQRNAITDWKVVDRFSYATLLELSLKTGRTHQIRVHMNAIGSPVIGDKTYGDFSGLPQSLQKASEQFGRQALHAKYLGFVHPATGKFMEFFSDIPKDMQELINKFSLKITKQ